MKRALCFVLVLALIIVMLPATTFKIYAAPAVELQNGSYNVTFKYTDNTAASVYVTGDFNSWSADSDDWKMVKNSSGEWGLTKSMDSGVYAYKLVVDGERKNDSTNNTYYPNSDNSKLVVPGFVHSPVISGDSVTFNFPVEQIAGYATSVKLKGSFNGWAEEEMKRSNDGSHYTITIEGLPAGTYEYGINVYTEDGPSYGTLYKDYYNMEAASLGGNSTFTIQASTTLKDGNDLIESRKPTEQFTGVYGQKLSDIAFDDTEWTWAEENTALSVGEQRYHAHFNTSQYENEYDFSVVEGYDSERHCVEVNLTVNVAKADTNLTITTDDMDKEYDGNAVGNPDVTKTGSTNDVIFTWFKANNGGWEPLDEAPVNTGSYKVVASVAEDSNYNGAETEKAFEIKIPKLPELHTHNLTLTTAKSATCTEDGNKAYYVCSGDDGCGKWFSDAAGTQEITDKNSVVISKTGHSFDESAWGYTGVDGHAHKCRNCNEHGIVQAHTPGAAATETTPQTCTVCGYEIAPAIGHTHNYENWQHNSTQHWKVCSCGTETGRGNHDLGDWITDREATATEAGTKHRDCQTCAYRETGTIPATGNEPGTGTVTPEVKPGANAPKTNISTPAAELEDMLLTEDEKRQVQNGTNIKIVLEVQDAGSIVSAEDKENIQQALNGFTVGQYLNIDLYKLVGAGRTNITETAKKIRIVITVPDSLKNTDSNRTRTFAVIRVHDGRAELLTDLDNSADTITIETDRFSTYAVVYKDSTNDGNDDGNNSGGNNSGGNNSGSNNSGGNNSGGNNGGGDNSNDTGDNNGDNGSNQNNANNNGTKPDSPKDDEPKTGDATPLEIYATLAMIAGFAYLLLYFTDPKRGMTEETKKELVFRLAGWAKQGRRVRKYLAFAAIFVLLVYYHSIGKKTCVEWKKIYGE